MEIGELANCTRSTTKQNTTHIEMKIHVRTSWYFPTTGCKYSFYMQRTKFCTYIFHRFMELVSALQSMQKSKKTKNISLIFCNGQFPMSNTECYIILDLCIRQHSYLERKKRKSSLMEGFKSRYYSFEYKSLKVNNMYIIQISSSTIIF